MFVSGITGQTGKRLEVLLAMVGLTQPRITQKDGAHRLEVSRSRAQQLVAELWRAWDKAAPPAGVWQLQDWADTARSASASGQTTEPAGDSVE